MSQAATPGGTALGLRQPEDLARMRVLIAGATGFIGRALVPLLQREGHSVAAWVRSEARGRSLLGADVEIVPADAGFAALVAEIERCEAVVNLAGEPLLGCRWTAARRTVLEDSRIGVTRTLVRGLEMARTRPGVFVSGSAVGYYGDRADELLTEASAEGDGYLTEICRRWEDAAQPAEGLGVRVVRLRIGVVLGRGGGALAQMLPAFGIGLGGPFGSGRQYLPWIHVYDLARVIAAALVDNRYKGPVNAVAPEQTTNRSFARALGAALRRPAVVPLPTPALKALFGPAATTLLSSQRVVPHVLDQLRFAFEFPTMEAALEDAVRGAPVTISLASSRPDEAATARYELRTRTVVDAPVGETFAFFSKAANLGLITPIGMQFTIAGVAPPMAPGATIHYTLRVGPLPVRWRTRIAKWEPGRRFVDCQEAGPYRLWWHEHTFQREGHRTVMEDRVYYSPPFGILGRIANRLFISTMLTNIFRYRGDVIRLRFGVSGGTADDRSSASVDDGDNQRDHGQKNGHGAHDDNRPETCFTHE
jgi:uncharacterized protein (TIGR01777 family)